MGRYIIVDETTLEALIDTCNRMTHHNYVPLGGPFYTMEMPEQKQTITTHNGVDIATMPIPFIVWRQAMWMVSSNDKRGIV